MEDSREQSPEWLRSFQAPVRTLLSISSSSDSDISPSDSPFREEASALSVRKKDDVVLVDSGEDDGGASPVRVANSKKGKQVDGRDLRQGTKNVYEEKATDEVATEKHVLPSVSTRVPLMLSDKVQRNKALIECEEDSIDLSGDIGAVGRVVISKTANGTDEMLLDLKGTLYKSSIIPSTTFCVVSFGQTEAKIESIMTDFVQLKPHSNVFETETMVEGTLEGFSFDSEDEGDNLQKNAAQQNDKEQEDMDQATGKTNKKPEKGPARKKVKIAAKPAAKSTKRGVRKPLNSRKGKGGKK